MRMRYKSSPEYTGKTTWKKKKNGAIPRLKKRVVPAGTRLERAKTIRRELGHSAAGNRGEDRAAHSKKKKARLRLYLRGTKEWGPARKKRGLKYTTWALLHQTLGVGAGVWGKRLRSRHKKKRTAGSELGKKEKG